MYSVRMHLTPIAHCSTLTLSFHIVTLLITKSEEVDKYKFTDRTSDCDMMRMFANRVPHNESYASKCIHHSANIGQDSVLAVTTTDAGRSQRGGGVLQEPVGLWSIQITIASGAMSGL